MKKLKVVFCAAVLVAWAASSAMGQSLRINVYSQKDARWSDHKMGSSGKTIGNSGCMMTCVAAAYRVTPAVLNTYLSSNKGYTSGGALDHYKAAGYDGPDGLQYVKSGSLPGNASSVGQGIKNGYVYIVRSYRFNEHWCLAYKATEGQVYYLDPIDGTTRRVGATDGWVSYGASARIYKFQ